MILDKHITKVISNNVNMTVPYYLMASYAYYEKDDPILSDDFYDKYLLNKDMLEAGSYIGKYPSIVLEALDNLRKTVKK